MRPVLFIAVLVLTVAHMGVGQEQSARGNHRTSVEETITKLDNERIQAQIHADATALDRIYAADFIGVGSSVTVRTKPQVILDFTSGDLKFQSITTDEVQVRVYGDTAVETGLSTMIGFFFQAEDGIRDRDVTGVQTCALPIWVIHVLAVGAVEEAELLLAVGGIVGGIEVEQDLAALADLLAAEADELLTQQVVAAHQIGRASCRERV